MNWKILAWQKSRRNLLGRSAFHYTMHEGHRKPLHLFLSPISDLCRVRLLRSQNQSSAILWLFPQVLLSIGAERQRIWLRLLYSKQNRKSSAAHGGLSLCHAAIQTGLFFFLNRYTRCALHHMLFCVTANTFMWFSVAVTATSEMTTTDREDRGYIYLKFTSTCSPLSKKKKNTFEFIVHFSMFACCRFVLVYVVCACCMNCSLDFSWFITIFKWLGYVVKGSR